MTSSTEERGQGGRAGEHVRDEALLSRVRLLDDRHAFATLMRRHQSAVRRFLRGLCQSDAWADDLAQQTFLQAYRKLEQYDGGGTFSGWLVRIAYRMFLQARRKQSHRFEHGAATGKEDASAPTQGDPLLRAALDQALRALPDEQRAVVVLCLRERMSHQEAASALEMPLGTVKSHLARARVALQGRLKVQYGQSGPAVEGGQPATTSEPRVRQEKPAADALERRGLSPAFPHEVV